MRELVAAALMVIGVALIFFSALGVLRMPDAFLRLAAATKATTLGIASLLGSAALHFHELEISSQAVATLIFVVLTSPVSGHMIARAAYVAGSPLWEGTVVDELRGRYNRQARRLESGPFGQRETGDDEEMTPNPDPAAQPSDGNSEAADS